MHSHKWPRTHGRREARTRRPPHALGTRLHPPRLWVCWKTCGLLPLLRASCVTRKTMEQAVLEVRLLSTANTGSQRIWQGERILLQTRGSRHRRLCRCSRPEIASSFSSQTTVRRRHARARTTPFSSRTRSRARDAPRSLTLTRPHGSSAMPSTRRSERRGILVSASAAQGRGPRRRRLGSRGLVAMLMRLAVRILSRDLRTSGACRNAGAARRPTFFLRRCVCDSAALRVAPPDQSLLDAPPPHPAAAPDVAPADRRRHRDQDDGLSAP